MQRAFLIAATMLCATTALGATFPSPPLYPSFTSRKAAITTFDVPGAAETIPLGVNARGEVAGVFLDPSNTSHGFIRKQSGSITKFEAPNASKQPGFGTTVATINAKGDIVGSYFDSSEVAHGFLRKANGAFTEIDVPNATETQPTAMNADEIAGSAFSGGAIQGFVRDATGTITIFTVNNKETMPTYIGADGTIVGVYVGSGGVYHGFRRNPQGKIVKFDPPNSAETFVAAINKQGVIAGYFFDASASNTIRGFIRATDGTFTVFDAPSSTAATAILGIDQFGDVLGVYLDADESPAQALGFLRNPAGKISSFAVTVAGVRQPTEAKSINDVGAIAGIYLDSKSIPHGFVRTP